MLPKSKLWALALTIAAALVLASCAPAATPTPAPAPAKPPTLSPTPSPAATPTPATLTPRMGGILKVNNRGDPAHLDLTQLKSYVAVQILSPAYSMLMQVEPQDITKLTNDLAERWEVSPDGKVYTFFLRKGVKWHDGQPLTSDDVKYSFEHYRNPPKGVIIQLKDSLENVERIEAPDEATIKFTLKRPQGSFLSVTALSFMVIYPKHLLQQDPNIMKKRVVGTGPFRLKDYNRGVSLELERNPDYFVKGRPYLDGIQSYIIIDPAAIMSAFRTGRIRLTDALQHLMTPEERQTVRKENPSVVVKEGPSPLAQYFIPNVTRKPWNDLRVRKAVYLGYDRQGAVRVPGRNDATQGADLVPSSGWDIPTEELLKVPGYRQPKDQDMAEAKRLLAEAGYPQGFSFELLTRNMPDIIAQAVYDKDQLARLGIEAKIKIVETGLFYALEAQHDFDALSHGVGYVLPDPDFIYGEQYITGSGGNWGLWSNPKFDELFRQQSSTLDMAQRKKLVRQMQDILIDDAGRIIEYYRVLSSLYYSEVRGWYFTPFYYLNRKMQDVWLAE